MGELGAEQARKAVSSLWGLGEGPVGARGLGEQGGLGASFIHWFAHSCVPPVPSSAQAPGCAGCRNDGGHGRQCPMLTPRECSLLAPTAEGAAPQRRSEHYLLTLRQPGHDRAPALTRGCGQTAESAVGTQEEHTPRLGTLSRD